MLHARVLMGHQTPSSTVAVRAAVTLLIVRSRAPDRAPPSRQRRGLGRRHHDPRPSRTGRPIARARVVGRIRRHSGEVSIHLVDQTDPRHRVFGRRLSQRAGHDHTGPVHAEMELPPAASPSAPMCRRGPRTCADDGQSRCWRTTPRGFENFMRIEARLRQERLPARRLGRRMHRRPAHLPRLRGHRWSPSGVTNRCRPDFLLSGGELGVAKS